MKIVEYYNFFNTATLRRLTLFLESTYFCNEKSVLMLHLAIVEFKTSHNGIIEEFDFEEIHEGVFKEKPYNENYLRVVFSKLIKLIDRFIEVEFCKVPTFHKLEFHSQNRLKKTYESLIQKAIGEEPLDYKDSFYYLNKSMLHDDYNLYLITSIGDNIELYKNNIIEFNHNFDTFYFLTKLKSFCSLINDQKILNTKYDISYKEELLAIIYSPKFDEIVPIRLYKLLYKLLVDENDIYEEFVFQVKSTAPLLDYEEVTTLLSHAQNYCIKKINQDKLEFFNKIFDIFKYRIDNNYILSQGELHPRVMKNIVTTALRVKEMEWTKKFITNFSKFLPANEYDKAFNFNMATYNFEMKQYSKTIELLSKVEYDDLFNGFNVRVLLIKSYFELNEIEPLDHLIASFKVFITRKKGFSDFYKKSHLHFLMIVKKMIDINPRDKKKITELKSKLGDLKPIAENAWLADKINKLQKS